VPMLSAAEAATASDQYPARDVDDECGALTRSARIFYAYRDAGGLVMRLL